MPAMGQRVLQELPHACPCPARPGLPHKSTGRSCNTANAARCPHLARAHVPCSHQANAVAHDSGRGQLLLPARKAAVQRRQLRQARAPLRVTNTWGLGGMEFRASANPYCGGWLC